MIIINYTKCLMSTDQKQKYAAIEDGSHSKYVRSANFLIYL